MWRKYPVLISFTPHKHKTNCIKLYYFSKGKVNQVGARLFKVNMAAIDFFCYWQIHNRRGGNEPWGASNLLCCKVNYYRGNSGFRNAAFNCLSLQSHNKKSFPPTNWNKTLSVDTDLRSRTLFVEAKSCFIAPTSICSCRETLPISQRISCPFPSKK